MKLAPTVLLLSLISSAAFARETEYRMKDARCFVTASGKDAKSGPIPPRTHKCFFDQTKIFEIFGCVAPDAAWGADRNYLLSREPVIHGSPEGTWNDVPNRVQLIMDSNLEYIWTETLTNGETLVQIRCTGEAEKF